MRLDKYVSTNFDLSRDAAIELIKAKGCYVNNQVVTKPASQIKENDQVTINQSKLCPYVSRAGLKLAYALEDFKIDPTGKNCLDIGSSTGGFTDCLLQHGARHVTCIDVGTEQMVDELRDDPRISLYEQTDIRTFQPSPNQSFDLITIDVSFISLSKIIPAVKNLVSKNTELILLYKPQYERHCSLEDIKNEVKKINYAKIKSKKSRQKGKGKTQEYIIFATNMYS